MSALSYISGRSVQAALETLGGVPDGQAAELLYLSAVTIRLRDARLTENPQMRAVLLGELLHELVWAKLMQLLGSPDREALGQLSGQPALSLLQESFRPGNRNTQALGALYYQHFCSRNEPLQHLKRHGTSYATFHRRLLEGYELLSRYLQVLELGTLREHDTDARGPDNEHLLDPAIHVENNKSQWVSDSAIPSRNLDNRLDGGASEHRGATLPGEEYIPNRRYGTLIGRSDAINELTQRLHSPMSAHHLIVAITGLGGIGKTALANEIVQCLLRAHLFRGVVWVSAKSEELEGDRIVSLPPAPVLTFESLQHLIVKQLGLYRLRGLPQQALRDELRRTLRRDSYLLIIDNLETASASRNLACQLHDLLGPVQPGIATRALVTSRERLLDIPYVYDYYLAGLSAEASEEFISREARDRGADLLQQADARLLQNIYLITHGMPLAMKLVVSQYLAGIAVDVELNRLREAREENLYRFLYLALWFSLSFSAQRVLVAAAAFSDIMPRAMLQPASGTSDEDFESAVSQLVRMSLLEASEDVRADTRRYDLHPMTRWFVNAPLRSQWERERAR